MLLTSPQQTPNQSKFHINRNIISMILVLVCLSSSLSDLDPLVTQEMVDAINNNPNAPFKATLYPKFAKMKVGDAKRFLSPVRPPQHHHGSAVPVGANEYFFNFVDRNYITGLTNVAAFPNLRNASNQNDTYVNPGRSIRPNAERMKFPVFDVTALCSSWAPAVTSAMTISVSRWAGDFVNFSLQFVLDCDILGDSCVERTPLSAYQLFWTYHPPDFTSWDKPGDEYSERTSFMQAPRSDFTRANCADDRCYPGLTGCKHHWALTGSCNPGAPETGCPIYFLYNWRWIKSHLWEVGAVTSSITVYQSLFTYGRGVYSGYWKLDGKTLNRWWWVIPHFGVNFGVAYDACNEQTTTTGTKNNKGDCRKTYENILDNKNGQIKIEPLKVVGSGNGEQSSTIKGFMKFNRRFDDCNIESHAVGAVPYNFVPLPHRTPEPTENPED